MLAVAPACVLGQPSARAVAGFDTYVRGVEARLARQHQSASGFLSPENGSLLHKDELIVEHLTPTKGDALPGATLYDWRGTAFVGGARAADFERLLKNFGGYPQYFSPQVVRARVLSQDGDRFQVQMRMRQRHTITVVLDARYDVTFGRLDARHGYSISRSTRIAEIASPGTSRERALTPSDAHGFLWRMNTYWSYEERDGGLYLQVESVSLTRSIPYGLGWAVVPFVESIPRESLEFTLRSVESALQKESERAGA
ncbi:MAG: hypothetical protein WAM66_04425 [Acidobacteriaceae bacterium]